MAVIRPMVESDLAEAERIVRLAFGTFLGAPDPGAFWPDIHYVHSRYGAEHIAGFAAVLDGSVVGSNFASCWGSVGYFGPLTIRPDLWNSGIGRDLVAAVCARFEEWGVAHAGLFTFAESAKHVHLYGKFGFHPRFLTAIMAAPATTAERALPACYSALAPDQRGAAEGACRELSDSLYDGLDLGGEIRTLAARALGDTILLRDGDSRLAGFAVCEWGPHSTAGAGCLLVKFAAARPGPDEAARFAALLDACNALAAANGMTTVLAPVNLVHEEAYRHLQGRGFRTIIQGVAMHRPNAPGYSRPGTYILDDWR